jgi:glutamate racemase
LKAIVIACGTVSTTSLDTLQAENALPIVGVVEPTCRRALLVTETKKVGIIATLASIRSGAYEDTLRRLDPTVEVIGKPCPLFVPLVENGRFRPGDVVIETVVAEYLTPIREAGVDTLVLGCTHYPLLREVIGAFMGPEVTLVDSGAEGARQVAERLTEEGMLAAADCGSCRYYVSDSTDGFAQLASIFLQRDVDGMVAQIDIGAYGNETLPHGQTQERGV